VVWTKERDLPRNDCKQCDANTHDRPLNHVIQVHTCSLLHSTRHRDTWYQTPPHECTTGVSGVFPGRSGVVRSFRNIFRNHRSGTEIMKGTYNKIITHNKVQGHGSPQNHVVQVHTCSLLHSTRHRDTIVFRTHHMSTRPFSYLLSGSGGYKHIRCVDTSGSIWHRASTASLCLLCSITMRQGGYNQLFPSIYIKMGRSLVNRCMIVCGHTSELEPGSGK